MPTSSPSRSGVLVARGRCVTVPADICEQVINHLAIGLGPDDVYPRRDLVLSTLSACALVCKDWYYLTWYHLHRHIHLRDRAAVLSLCKTFKERPRLPPLVQQVTIAGNALAGGRGPIAHLGTFAAMLAGRIPNVSVLAIEDAIWSLGATRADDDIYFSAFRSVDTLVLDSVTLPSISQLARVVSALPLLDTLVCEQVDCAVRRKPNLAPVSLPFHCASLNRVEIGWVAPEIEEFFVQLSRACTIRYLTIGIDSRPLQKPENSRSQMILEACASSLQSIEFDTHPDFPVESHKDGAVGKHYNISPHSEIQSLKISLYCTGTNGLSWLSPIISLSRSEHLRSLDVAFVPIPTCVGEDIEEFLRRLNDSPVLTQLDDVLQEARFTRITPFYVHMSIINSSKSIDEYILGKGSVKGEWARWSELVMQKMPQSARRGILSARIEGPTAWAQR